MSQASDREEAIEMIIMKTEKRIKLFFLLDVLGFGEKENLKQLRAQQSAGSDTPQLDP